MIGTNDVGFHTLEVTTTPIAQMVTAAQAANIRVVLTTIPPTRGAEASWNPAVLALNDWIALMPQRTTARWLTIIRLWFALTERSAPPMLMVTLIFPRLATK